MKKLLLFLLLLPCSCHAFTTVTLSTSAPLSVEKAFIANTTTYFNAGLFVNPLASNTYAIKLFGMGEPVTVLGNSFDECIAQGVSDGMDWERSANLGILQNLQRADISSGTCAGIGVSTTTFSACQLIYNQIGAAIMVRWNQIYSSSGSVVAP